ncbi:unnamed protein product [Medioppia subpectinata]|uniref:Lysozyme n=1 Tax=Medioppia subpectinata TaxID=1979941 RepID=A0A7R9PXF8_9ACAR|nr:unnamed protein product [Medioppia subpectinata]CAG2104778.1 unnamed protein product [Medioppia subpectinata]
MIKTISVLFLVVALVSGRNINRAGIDMIKSSERFVANFYADPVGIPTVGYGHNCNALGCDTIRAPLTQAQGEALLLKDLAQYQNCVNDQVPFVNDNQFAALVSFTFNSGCAALKNSTLLKYVKARDYSAAANEFGKWVKGGPEGHKQTLKGLVARRERERQLFVA